eukprot:s301_g11.t2
MAARSVRLIACAAAASRVLPSLAFNGCDGSFSRAKKDTWDEVKYILEIDMAGREDGRSVDPRSDNLNEFRQIMNREVLPDLENAVKDCVFGVISLIWLTLALVDSEEGLERARELEAIADGLFFQFSELVEESGWPLDPTKFFGYRQLLGHEDNECGASQLRVFMYNSTSDLTQRRLITGSGMMAAATHMHSYLERASCIVQDPETADLFFIPAYHGDQYNSFLEKRAHADDSEFSHLARRRGQDHFFVVSANLPSWKHLAPLRNTILLTVESWQINDDLPRWYSPWKDIMIPGYIDRWRIDAMRMVNKPTNERGFLMVFHGNHPGNHGLYVAHKAKPLAQAAAVYAAFDDQLGGRTALRVMTYSVSNVLFLAFGLVAVKAAAPQKERCLPLIFLFLFLAWKPYNFLPKQSMRSVHMRLDDLRGGSAKPAPGGRQGLLPLLTFDCFMFVASEVLVAEAHTVAAGRSVPRLFGRSFHDAPVGNADWVNHKPRIFVLGDMDPTAPMDRLDGVAQHASLTGAMPAAPAGERLPLLEDGTPPMAPDPLTAKLACMLACEGGGLDNPDGASPLINIDKRRLIAKPDRLRPGKGPPVVGSLKRELSIDGTQGLDRLSSGEAEAVATVDQVPAYVSRYLEQRVNLDQRRITEKRLSQESCHPEWDRADVNKDGVVSDEEFSLELHDRQGKSADEVERLWERYHQSEDEFMTKAESLRLARTGYDLGTISRKDVSAMMTPSSMEGLGFWGAGATCPAGAYVTGAQIKKMKALLSPSVDESGVNALRFQCSDGTKVATAEGPDGEWSNWTSCPAGQAVYGFRSQGRSPRSGLDNAGITGLEFSCRASDLSAVSKLNFSTTEEAAWSEELRCPPGETVMQLTTWESQTSASTVASRPSIAHRVAQARRRASSWSSAELAERLLAMNDTPIAARIASEKCKNVRTQILESFTGIPDCSVGGPVSDFFQRMGRTHFCLVPRGSSAWTIHLYESFFFGCIPVIISDFLDVPFQNVVDWPALSIKWPEDKVGPELLSYLRSIPLERIAKMKQKLEEAACFFDFHRGWGRKRRNAAGDDSYPWLSWAKDQVALGVDCQYLQHGDGTSAEDCKRSCTQNQRCNTVNFSPGRALESGDCVLRSCRDPAQPALTGSASGWQVWSMVNDTDLHCSPYHAIFSQLKQRTSRPLQQGSFWH